MPEARNDNEVLSYRDLNRIMDFFLTPYEVQDAITAGQEAEKDR